MLSLVRYELYDLAQRPLFWIGCILFCVFLLNVVGHLNVDEDEVRVGVYLSDEESLDREQSINDAETLLQEMSGVKILQKKTISSDLVTQLLIDQADIAVTRAEKGWQFLVRSRSALEHKRLVRIAQVLAASLSQRKPWPLIAYEAVGSGDNAYDPSWPSKVKISGISADPDSHARTFVPKVISLLSFVMSFAFVSRSFVRDISSNMLPVLIVRSGWISVILSRIVVATIAGIVTSLALLAFAMYAQGFYPKAGIVQIALVQVLAIMTSGFVGITFALLSRTESRIFLAGAAYVIFLILLSGLIAQINPKQALLYYFSNLVPLGYAMDAMNDWMFFGMMPKVDEKFQILTALLFVSVAATYGGAIFYKRRI